MEFLTVFVLEARLVRIITAVTISYRLIKALVEHRRDHMLY